MAEWPVKAMGPHLVRGSPPSATSTACSPMKEAAPEPGVALPEDRTPPRPRRENTCAFDREAEADTYEGTHIPSNPLPSR